MEKGEEMNMQVSNPEQYSELWKDESDLLESHKIYERLSKITPSGNVLEFGCGAGKGTRHLAIGRALLALDSNSYLIAEAKKYLHAAGVSHNIHKCDFFNLTAEDKNVIKEFNPEVIVGWFIGSHGMDIHKHTEEESNELTKSKLYREKIEDIIVSPGVCLDSVKYIHLVNRGGAVVGFSESVHFISTKNDYDMHVFRKIGFEVVDVKLIDWSRVGSDFPYGSAPSSNLAQGESIPIIVSIVAQRI
jgi:SAM-dependent methyltransferase